MTLLINQSIKAEIFPDKLKIAKVVPLNKKDEKKLKTIGPSVLPSVSKVLFVTRFMISQ